MQATLRRGWQLWRTNPGLFYRRSALYLRSPRQGFQSIIGTRRRAARALESYQSWLADDACARRLHGTPPAASPLLSVLMPVYNTDPEHLADAIESVRAQTYPRWELCVVDDASDHPSTVAALEELARRDQRIRLRRRAVRGHIAAASNDALALAGGEFVVLLDHDDVLTPDALEEIARTVAGNPEVDFVYSDEDKLDPAGERRDPFFKPAWSPELLTVCNYVTHLAALRRTLVLEVGGFRAEFAGSQDHDLFLRIGERARAVAHIPRVLYSWRMAPTSTAMAVSAKPYAVAASRRAVSQALERRGGGDVEESHLNGIWQVRHPLAATVSVSLVVVGEGEAWRSVLGSEGVALRDVHFLSPGALATVQGLAVVERLEDLRGEYLIWLDASSRVSSPRALERLLEPLQEPGVALAGGLTLGRDGRVAQAGLVVEGRELRYAFAGLEPVPQPAFYLNLSHLTREVSAVHLGCSAMRSAAWRALGGWSLHLPPVPAHVDLALRALARGQRVVFSPQAALVAEHALPPLPRIQAPCWSWEGYRDPFWNPNLNPASADGLPYQHPTAPLTQAQVSPNLARSGASNQGPSQPAQSGRALAPV